LVYDNTVKIQESFISTSIMPATYNFPIIGIIHSCFKEKFGIPRQPGLAPLAKARLELLAPYNEPTAVEGLENVSHIWVQFVFHENAVEGWKPKVRPPRLGGNQSLGVFATRSPVRPSPIGLSVVKLDAIETANGLVVLHLSGVDFLDATPVLDIKPYVPYVDQVADAVNPIASVAPDLKKVTIPDIWQRFCQDYQSTTSVPLAELITQVLQQDPKPAYQQPDSERIYGMKLLDLDVRWRYLPSGEILLESLHFTNC
jgi:tRNA (adenine37-N6)-methyltransferase